MCVVSSKKDLYGYQFTVVAATFDSCFLVDRRF